MNWRHNNPAVPVSRALGMVLLSIVLLAMISFAHDVMML